MLLKSTQKLKRDAEPKYSTPQIGALNRINYL
jgi:hypothetical protein